MSEQGYDAASPKKLDPNPLEVAPGRAVRSPPEHIHGKQLSMHTTTRLNDFALSLASHCYSTSEYREP